MFSSSTPMGQPPAQPPAAAASAAVPTTPLFPTEVPRTPRFPNAVPTVAIGVPWVPWTPEESVEELAIRAEHLNKMLADKLAARLSFLMLHCGVHRHIRFFLMRHCGFHRHIQTMQFGPAQLSKISV